MDRRRFLKMAAGASAAAGLGFPSISCNRSPAVTGRKVIVLGLDGLAPQLVSQMIAAGRAPNFEKLARLGAFKPLGTTMPALSPVAWSSFITGLTPGGHGIADFTVRDPKTYMPKFSIFDTEDPSTVMSIGDYQLPIAGGAVTNLRRGKPFWSYLEEAGIDTLVTKIPTNFPIDENVTRGISGMGTPDIADSYGVFNYYTSDEFEHFKNISGGNVQYVEVRDNVVRGNLIGPVNSLKKTVEDRNDPFANCVRVPFTIYTDPKEDLARIDIQGESILLRTGEYSDWIQLDFTLMPVLGNVSGIARFLIKSVRDHFRMYVTPINIDPADQAMPITIPSSYGADLVRHVGYFWTKGLPADTKAFDYGVLNDEEYVKQAELILKERMELFDYQWERFDSGLFYFYVSSTDQDTHMLWRNMDKNHPMHQESDPRFAGYLPHLYEEMDKLVGKVLPAVDDETLLLICSDHGFAQFGRQFHLNSWLRRNGYLTVKKEAEKKEQTTVLDVDWSQTGAYAMGFNGLYVNLKGREGQGIIEPEKAGQLAARLTRELQAIVDPETGMRPITRVYPRDDLYSGEMTPLMPEMLVGYTPGYRSSSSSVMGETGSVIVDLNPWAWSGDHSMARDLVPGSLFSSRPVSKGSPDIWDLPVTILEYFGLEKPQQMVGSSIYKAG